MKIPGDKVYPEHGIDLRAQANLGIPGQEHSRILLKKIKKSISRCSHSLAAVSAKTFLHKSLNLRERYSRGELLKVSRAVWGAGVFQ
jgi:hypothetical protein